jgi:NADH-quinone oxidoreductase subunit M
VTVFISALKVYPALGSLAICALVLSALYMLRVVQRTFYGPRNERYARLPDVSLSLGLPRMILVAAMVLFGLFPRLMLDLIQSAVIPFMGGLPR